MRDLLLFLQEFDVSVNLAAKIYKVYGAEARRKVSENPYALIEDIWGVGFVKADRIAQKLGFAHDSYKRIRAGLAHIMQEASGDGHSYLPPEELAAKAAAMMEVEPDLVTFTLDHAVEAHLLVREEGAVYLPLFFNAECSVAEMIAKKLKNSRGDSAPQDQHRTIEQWIDGYRQRTGWHGDPMQIKAIRDALCNPVFLLTGGPGTGKTTILQVIVAFFRENHRTVALAAPTGRAAQRMGSISGLSAKTIHRLLEFRPGGGGTSFQRNEQNPVEADVIILDEVSMVDLSLMKSFLAAVKAETSLILVGDDNQLPSVGAGNVLGDIITSSAIAHVHLTTVFRQAAASRIVTAAHEIIHGNTPSFTNGKNDNCFFMYEEDPQACLETIVDLTSRRLPERYGLDPINDIQVLAPMHKGTLGTQNLNAVLAAKLNSHTEKVEHGALSFSPGDKVMQIRNNYDSGIFNGDIGIVERTIDETGLSVNFDGTLVQYEYKDLDEIILAYCISIHKSQGCEFKAVIIPLATQHYIMLQRNLIYTALTRARELCILVGTQKALSIAVRNDGALRRYSRLGKRLAGYNNIIT